MTSSPIYRYLDRLLPQKVTNKFMLIHKKRELQSPGRDVSLRVADETHSPVGNDGNIESSSNENDESSNQKIESTKQNSQNKLPPADKIIAAEPRPGVNQFKTRTQSASSFPKKFESYALLWEICRDALSVSYAAQREGMEGLLSVRIFDGRTTSATQLRTIQQAAKKASELTHPNHITVYDNAVAVSGEPYVVTDYAEAESLAQLFPVVKRLNVARFLSIFKQVCEVLQEAHSRQLVHANLAPNKILLMADECDADIVKIIDFGMPPDPVQNAFYLSPEQSLDRNKIDARTDIYSLGCIMYEALCGSPPFVGHSKSQTAINYLHELANQYSPEAPEHNALKLLDCIIAKCLQKKPSKRFRSINELMDALRLVNDCICNGSSKKLPPKAEKLLLFRFLDFFDKKIIACMFSYLLLGGIAVKYIGEIQLQKNIDEAELAILGHDLPLAQSSWKAAINQAYLLNKPESLKAELHWELGSVLEAEAIEANLRIKPKYSRMENAIDLSKDAIAEFEKALPYYQRGTHFRSCSIMLLHHIAQLWDSISTNIAAKTAGEIREQDAKALKEASALYNARDYRKCAEHVEHYLINNRILDLNRPSDSAKASDSTTVRQLCKLAAYSCSKIAVTLPPSKAVRYFERTLYFFNLADDLKSQATQNLQTCWQKTGGYWSPEADAWDAAAAGDELAALGELAGLPENNGANTGCASCPRSYAIKYACEDYLELQNEAQDTLKGRSVEAIAPLEDVLKLEEAGFGKHNVRLAYSISQLARSYAAKNDTERASALYKRLFCLLDGSLSAPLIGGNGTAFVGYYDADLVVYYNLLEAKGEHKESLALLEKYLFDKNSETYYRNGMKYMLVKAYARAGLRNKASEYLSKNIWEAPEDPEPEQLSNASDDAFSAGNRLR